MFKKVIVVFKDWKVTQFLDANTSVDRLSRIFPKATSFEIDKTFVQLSHGASSV